MDGYPSTWHGKGAKPICCFKLYASNLHPPVNIEWNRFLIDWVKKRMKTKSWFLPDFIRTRLKSDGRRLPKQRSIGRSSSCIRQGFQIGLCYVRGHSSEQQDLSNKSSFNITLLTKTTWIVPCFPRLWWVNGFHLLWIPNQAWPFALGLLLTEYFPFRWCTF